MSSSSQAGPSNQPKEFLDAAEATFMLLKLENDSKDPLSLLNLPVGTSGLKTCFGVVVKVHEKFLLIAHIFLVDRKAAFDPSTLADKKEATKNSSGIRNDLNKEIKQSTLYHVFHIYPLILLTLV